MKKQHPPCRKSHCFATLDPQIHQKSTLETKFLQKNGPKWEHTKKLSHIICQMLPNPPANSQHNVIIGVHCRVIH